MVNGRRFRSTMFTIASHDHVPVDRGDLPRVTDDVVPKILQVTFVLASFQLFGMSVQIIAEHENRTESAYRAKYSPTRLTSGEKIASNHVALRTAAARLRYRAFQTAQRGLHSVRQLRKRIWWNV